jgi:prolipoprotein diacylglyceryltransferase
MLPILQLGPLAIQLPGLLLLIGVWIAINLIEKEAPRQGVPPQPLINMIFFSLLAGIFGARMGYALRFIDIYLQDPVGILSLNPSTLAPTEGFAAALIVALVYAQRKKLPLWPTLDSLAPGVAMFALFTGLAHLSSGDAFGAPSTIPWAIELWGMDRHPSQVYEIIAAGVVFLIINRIKAQSPFLGFTFLNLVALLGVSRLFLEAFRGDSVIVLGVVRGAQLGSLAVTLSAMVLLHFQAVRQARVDG